MMGAAGGLADGFSPGRAPADQQEIRRRNLGLVMRHVSPTVPSTRARLAAQTGLTKATVSSLVAELLRGGFMVELGTQTTGHSGRPGSELGTNTHVHAGVGLEINVDYAAACVTDLGHNVRYHHVVRMDNREEARRALQRVARMGSAALDAAAEAGLTPYGVGLAVPGIVDPSTGRLLHAPNLGWSDLPITGILCGMLGLDPDEIRLDNEANLGALAELWFGGGAEWGDFVHVSGEIGVGAGIVTGGRTYRGVHGFAGEIGHISIDPAGEPCGCGGRGCVERFCGQEAILRAAGLDTDPATTTGKPDGPVADLVRALDAEGPDALRAVRRAGQALGTGLANVANIVDPDTVVLGGIFTALAPWLTEPLTETLQGQSIAQRWSPQRVAISTLGPDAAVRGAAGLVVQEILNDPGVLTQKRPGRRTTPMAVPARQADSHP